jgi:diacylglycerol kinase family enzyme
VEKQKKWRVFSEVGLHTLDVLIALGGDGTIQRAAQQYAENTAFLIPLPGGTMNILPRALYGELSWEDALKNTLATPSAKVLSGGNAMGRRSLSLPS